MKQEEQPQQVYPPPQYYYHQQQQQQQQQQHHDGGPHQQYGTFQQPGGYPGYPAPARPQYSQEQSQLPSYHAVPVYPILEPSSEDYPPLPCCGFGIGWFLFILGFFIASISWYVGAFLLACTTPDPRERVGLTCCAIAATLSLIAAIVGGTTAAF